METSSSKDSMLLLVCRFQVTIASYKMFELSSLATALDMQKVLAEQAHEIHSEVTVRKKKYHDAEVRTVKHILYWQYCGDKNKS